MALAWKAGWVNSPQGFESPILRHPDPGRSAQTPGGAPRARPGVVASAPLHEPSSGATPYREVMTTTGYAALLRGINVGGHRRVPMAELRALMTDLGHADVRTHLQSGNAVFTSAETDEQALAAQLERAIEARFGFAVDVLVRDHAYLAGVVGACPFPAATLESRQLHVTYCSGPLDGSRLAALDTAAYLPEELR